MTNIKKKKPILSEQLKTHLGIALISLVLVGSGLFLIFQKQASSIKVEEKSDNTASTQAHQPEKKINLNTAGQEDLESLSGIGPVLAQRIIAFRDDIGEFGTIEEIKEVQGIGDSLFEKIKDQITVEQ